jgi:hypothetical protein
MACLLSPSKLSTPHSAWYSFLIQHYTNLYSETVATKITKTNQQVSPHRKEYWQNMIQWISVQ